MDDWKVIQDLDQGYKLLNEVDLRLGSTGVEKIAVDAAVAMEQASAEAFASKRDPRTGAAWEPPSESTLRDRQRHPGVGPPPLVLTGQLRGDVVSGYKLVPGGAVAFVNVQAEAIRKAMINLYGVIAKRSRTWVISKTGKTSSPRRRLRPSQAWPPARRFVGLSDSKVAEILDKARATMTEGLP
jgi:phage gpG-like protein